MPTVLNLWELSKRELTYFNLIYSFIHNMCSITIQFESWVQIDTCRQVQKDKESLVTALYLLTKLHISYTLYNLNKKLTHHNSS